MLFFINGKDTYNVESRLKFNLSLTIPQGPVNFEPTLHIILKLQL